MGTAGRINIKSRLVNLAMNSKGGIIDRYIVDHNLSCFVYTRMRSDTEVISQDRTTHADVTSDVFIEASFILQVLLPVQPDTIGPAKDVQSLRPIVSNCCLPWQ